MIDIGICVACDKARTQGSLEFCRACYNIYKDDIKEKKSWVRELKNSEQKERRRREREFDNTSLDQIVDRTWGNNRY